MTISSFTSFFFVSSERQAFKRLKVKYYYYYKYDIGMNLSFRIYEGVGYRIVQCSCNRHVYLPVYTMIMYPKCTSHSFQVFARPRILVSFVQRLACATSSRHCRRYLNLKHRKTNEKQKNMLLLNTQYLNKM